MGEEAQVTEGRPHSRKVRALTAALGQPVEEIVREYAGLPLSQQQVAQRWQTLVHQAFPELGLTYSRDDVSRLFKRYGFGSQAVLSGTARVP